MFKLKKAATAAEHMCVFDELQQIVSRHIFYALHLGSNWIRPQPSLKISTISLGNFQNRERVATETTTIWTIGQSGQLEKKLDHKIPSATVLTLVVSSENTKCFFSLSLIGFTAQCALLTQEKSNQKKMNLWLSVFFSG